MGFKGRVIALTGNIACGKSTVARMLAELGVPVIDADQVSREVTAPGSVVLTQICNAFGKRVLDTQGGLDRKALRAVAFQNEAGRRLLESILHPAIRDRSTELINEQFDAGKPVIIYEASLIIEVGRQGDFDGVLVVTCDTGTQKRRLLERDPSLTAEIADQLIAAQMRQEDKSRFATWLIENTGSIEDLKGKVRDWHDRNVAHR